MQQQTANLAYSHVPLFRLFLFVCVKVQIFLRNACKNRHRCFCRGLFIPNFCFSTFERFRKIDNVESEILHTSCNTQTIKQRPKHKKPLNSHVTPMPRKINYVQFFDWDSSLSCFISVASICISVFLIRASFDICLIISDWETSLEISFILDPGPVQVNSHLPLVSPVSWTTGPRDSKNIWSETER